MAQVAQPAPQDRAAPPAAVAPLAAASGFAGAAEAFMGLGVLFLIAALLVLALGWRGPRRQSGRPHR
ncbi:MAG: hypothetical protein COW30_06670 [Rhodospirillales bacterium CG15_BIG_FIL_POST_REV_8_21_14_020_66_15]|nr:MAG: hypothetical protein COW30_06670 [Rhodospirillales bacterium CG15_BIG_FIL_POST_REV_8_21_14_020_66_15]